MIIIYLTQLEILAFLREKIALFWTFLYPVLLLVVLAFFFSGNGESNSDFNLYYHDSVQLPISQNFLEALKVESESLGININLVPEKDIVPFGSVLMSIYSDRDAQGGLEIVLSSPSPGGETILLYKSIASNTINRLSSEHQKINFLYHLSVKERVIDRLDYIPFLITGVAAITIITTSLFGFSVPLISMRESGFLKIYQILPFSKWAFLFSYIASRALIIILFTYLFVFGFHHLYGFSYLISWSSYFLSLGYIVAAVMFFLSFGFLFSSMFDRASLAGVFVTLLNIPITLISDAIVPINKFPDYLSSLAGYFPPTVFVQSLRNVLYRPDDISLNIAALLVCIGGTAVFMFLGVRMFRWNSVRV